MGSAKDLELGRLLCGGFQGTTVTPQAYTLIVELKISTMILSLKNAVSVKQMSKLIKDLQWVAYNQGGYQYPLMFAIDQEGGMMNTLFDEEFITQFPGAMALASTRDPELVYEVSKATAVELKKIGFLIILGPVLDVITKLSHQLIGVRSFGTTIDEVTKYGGECARGLRDGGMFTFGKHFPGVGNSTVDSLLELPVMTDTLDQVRNVTSVPFGRLINKGYLDGITVSGCGVPSISPDETHACLSPILVNQLLREEMKFDGVILCECLEIEALFHSFGLSQGVILAVSAGCDLIMVCHNLSLQSEALDSLKKALQNEVLEESTIRASLNRIRRLQIRLPSWVDIFPDGETSAKKFPSIFKYSEPELWKKHHELSARAYKSSITLVRDMNETLPLTKYIKLDENEVDNILILTPLLNIVYPNDSSHKDASLFTGETVFQKFGEMLSNHQSRFEMPYNILHTSYTANGLTPQHESLIEKAKVVVVFTSEASRNVYQIGLVKYVAMLCGAKPSYKMDASTFNQATAKPLIIVATLSPYDFLYNIRIGSAYLCCYDYTNDSLKQLVGVLMGDSIAEGCLPGEEKLKNQKRKRGISEVFDRPKSHAAIKKRWLVDVFDMGQDWSGLVTLWKDTAAEFEVDTDFNYQLNGFFNKLFALFMSTTNTQKHFVVRNSSLRILYGAVITWVGIQPNGKPIGSILYISVDKSKRVQNLGKSLLNRAVRYLIQERLCENINFGGSFPLLFGNNARSESRLTEFLKSAKWDIKAGIKEKHIMIIHNLINWQVPSHIFRELKIIGVRFDICQDFQNLIQLIDRADIEVNDYQLYREAISQFSIPNNELKIIIAIEPTNQAVIGSLILFTNRSPISKFYPFIDECVHSKVTGDNQSGYIPLVGGMVGMIVDPLYTNLAEIFRYGLICTGLTYLILGIREGDLPMEKCVLIGNEDNSGLEKSKEIGFQEWKHFYSFYNTKSARDFV